VPACSIKHRFGTRARAVTLVELLVVIAIIGTLLGLLAPALLAARARARAIVCQSNLRQIVAATLIYVDEQRAFPFGRDVAYVGRSRWGYAGTHWFGADDPSPGLRMPADRPLNPYLGLPTRSEQETPDMRCPGDSGCFAAGTGNRTWESLAPLSNARDAGASSHSIAGTSYELNTWIYCRPGAIDGYGSTPTGGFPVNFRGTLGPHHITPLTSAFVLVGDTGCMSGGRQSRTGRARQNSMEGWWHGREIGQLGMLDGSILTAKSMSAPTTSRYTFFVNPRLHTGGTVFPEQSWSFW